MKWFRAVDLWNSVSWMRLKLFTRKKYEFWCKLTYAILYRLATGNCLQFWKSVIMHAVLLNFYRKHWFCFKITNWWKHQCLIHITLYVWISAFTFLYLIQNAIYKIYFFIFTRGSVKCDALFKEVDIFIYLVSEINFETKINWKINKDEK